MAENELDFSKCDTCLKSRMIVSENGIHSVCCLSVKRAIGCLSGVDGRYVGLKGD
jgi:hypothetical protein